MPLLLKFFPLLASTLILSSCDQMVHIKTRSNNSSPSLTIGAMALTSADFSQNISISIPFSGDANNNATVTLYFCSIKVQAGCNPLSGESVVLTKSGSSLLGTVNIASSNLTPGDMMKYQLVSSDSDGISGKDDFGYILIPYDGSAPRAIRQLGKFAFGSGTPHLGAQGNETVTCSSLASDGSLFIGGSTNGDLGEQNGVWDDAYIVKIKSDGSLDTEFGNGGIFQLGVVSSISTHNEYIQSIVLDGSGNLFAGGYTGSSLGGANAGGNDAFIIKLNTSSGALDSSFGDGDGTDNDGILQINALNSNSATGNDIIWSMALDGSGNLFAGGYTGSSLGGANAGSNDAFIIKLNASSGILDSSFGDGDGLDNDGILQINASNSNSATGGDNIRSISLDGSGNLYAGGHTISSLGGTNAGSNDAFIIKLDASSGILDSSFGDGDGLDNDGIIQVNASNSNSATGSDVVQSIALDGSGNLYAGGYTTSSLGGTNAGSNDAFIIKLDASSGILDSNFGDSDGIDNDGIIQVNALNSNSATGDDNIWSIALDASGNLYAAGRTPSSLGGTNAGINDVFIVKLDTGSGVLDSSFGDGDGIDNDGILQINALNSNSATGSDVVQSIVLDGSGYLYAGGYTTSSLGGTNAGTNDAFIIKLDASSGVLDSSFGGSDGLDNDGILQINASNSNNAIESDYIESIALDGVGNLYAGGYTTSSLGGANAGINDAFVIKLDASSGVLDSSFGDGDGIDNDGILQINALNSNSATGDDFIQSIVLDGSGNLYAGGRTTSSLGGTNAGSDDAFIIKLDASSGVLSTSFGNGDGLDNDGILQINALNANSATGTDHIYSIALDGSGNLVAGGSTSSSLSGTNAGNFDAFIIKLDASSGVLDSSFGDGDGIDNDGILQINASNSNDASGTDYVRSIALDGSGNLYGGGFTTSSLGGTNAGGYDAFIIKLDASAGVLDSSFGDSDGLDNDGILQINAFNASSATGTDYIYSIALDGVGNLYAGGSTSSSLGGTNAGSFDAFIVKLDASSGVLNSSFGDGDGIDNDGILQINASNSNSATGNDTIWSIALDGSGNLYAGGYTGSSLGGTNAGINDAFITKLDTSSGLLDSSFGDGDGIDDDGILQINALNSNSATEREYIQSIALDASGNLYAGGRTDSSLGETNAGGSDAFSLRIAAGNDGL